MDVAAVETTHILAYLNYLRTDYVPRRIPGNNDKKLSPKTVYNLYISVASFFTWASREFNLNNPMKGIPRLRVPEDPPVEPFKKEEIELLIKACDFCEEAVTDRRRKFIMQRSISKRHKAILLTSLDTGLRAGELCAPPREKLFWCMCLAVYFFRDMRIVKKTFEAVCLHFQKIGNFMNPTVHSKVGPGGHS